MENDLNIKHEIDVCGHCCPIPIMTTVKMLSKINSGELIRIKFTDSAFKQDVLSLQKQNKLEVLETIEHGDFDTYIIKKS